MKRYALTLRHARVVTPVGTQALRGEQMGEVQTIDDATVAVADDGTIAYVGADRDDFPSEQEIDLEGRALIPGFVDSHTHMVFGGSRPDEFAMRMRGASYMEIMQAGGGIQSTVDATRRTDADTLLRRARGFVNRMVEMGVTTVEAKSGYGLDVATEEKMLSVIERLRRDPDTPLDIVATFMGAHAVPREYAGRTGEYVDHIITDMLPRFRHLADNCDIFCERNVFELDDSRRLMQAAARMGYKLKFHADEIVTLGGAELAADMGALSADHLLHVSDEGIRRMAERGTVATLLPLTAFSLREPYAPARRMIDSGCAVALATDLNPGSCFSGSIPLTIALACIYMGMTVEETLTALTLNGAAALGLADKTGSIEPGKAANMAVLHYDTIAMLPYYIGMNCVKTTIHRGRIVASNPTIS